MKETNNNDDGHEDQALLSEAAEANYMAATLPTKPESSSSFFAQTPSATTAHRRVISSLDFERIVNAYSIQAVRDQWILSPQQEGGTAVDVVHAPGRSRPSEISDDNKATNNKYAMKLPKRHLLGYTGRTATRWVLSAVAGLFTGLTSILIVEITSQLVQWRSQQMQTLIMHPDYSDGYVLAVFSLLNLAASMSASWLCVAWAPHAVGSGISQVKAYLNGIRLLAPNQHHVPTLFFVKIVGTILSVSSCLALGMEGPLIYIGAITGASCTKVSAALSRWLVTCQRYNSTCGGGGGGNSSGSSRLERWLSWTTIELSHFATDAERRDLVSIGASCGFAASFGAPIGGLLFILDDVSSYFTRSLLLRMLVANAIGTFCLAVQHRDLSNYSVISLGTYETVNDNIFVTRLEELPLYLFMGTAGGILGGLFSASFMWLRRNVSAKFPVRERGKWQLLQVALLSLLTSILLFYLPSMKWACKERTDASLYNTNASQDDDKKLQDFTTEDSGHSRFFCPPGQVNELGNILFGSRIDAIKRILTDPSEFKRETLLTVGILFYVLMTLTFGAALPSGIFTPSVLIGASLGGAAGITFQEWFGADVTPSTFALLGVAALLAGIQRSTVSLCVILVEGTGQIKILMPAIITVVVARYVASLIYKKGIFEAVMEWAKLPYLDDEENKRRYDAIQVREIMSEPPMETVKPFELAKDLVNLLRNSVHNGFPVVDPMTNKFLGLVRRDQIAALLECGVFEPSNENVSLDKAVRSPCSTMNRPYFGVEKNPLMQWAYHINDDRYDYSLKAASTFQTNSELVEPAAPKHSVLLSSELHTTRFTPLPIEFASIGMNQSGLIVVSWFNPAYDCHFVNLGAVMNLGAFCVRKLSCYFAMLLPTCL